VEVALVKANWRERERKERKKKACVVAKLLENLPFEVARTHLKRRETETNVVAKLWKSLAKRSVVVAKLFGELLAFCRLHAFVCVCVCVRERERESEAWLLQSVGGTFVFSKVAHVLRIHPTTGEEEEEEEEEELKNVFSTSQNKKNCKINEDMTNEL
jgi:hypothetical protein